EGESAKNPVRWGELMREHEVSVWNSVPALMGLLKESEASGGQALAGSRRLGTRSGERIPGKVAVAVRGERPRGTAERWGGGRERGRGEVEIWGRGDGQEKVRGYRIEVGEVEAALRECEGVKAAVVKVVGERGEARRLVGYVEMEGKGGRSEEEVKEEMRRKV